MPAAVRGKWTARVRKIVQAIRIGSRKTVARNGKGIRRRRRDRTQKVRVPHCPERRIPRTADRCGVPRQSIVRRRIDRYKNRVYGKIHSCGGIRRHGRIRKTASAPRDIETTGRHADPRYAP